MNVLIACEASQTVCIEFRKLGHNAYSADITPCYGYHPEWHILGDCIPLLNGYTSFYTQDGKLHDDLINTTWDLIIAHPPCTYLSRAGACNLFDFYGKIKNSQRFEKGLEARDFFMKFFEVDCKRVCIENPIPIKLFNLPGWTQIIEPYYFGDPYSKKTCLWLKGLPELRATNIVPLEASWTKIHSSAKIRSKTFPGIASAMAEQWSTMCNPMQLSIFS